MKFFELVHGDGRFGQAENIRFDPLARFGWNVEEVALRFLSEDELKRLWRAAHAQETRAS